MGRDPSSSPCRAIMYCSIWFMFMNSVTVSGSTTICRMKLWRVFIGVNITLTGLLCRRGELLPRCDLMAPQLVGRRAGLLAWRCVRARLREQRQRLRRRGRGTGSRTRGLWLSEAEDLGGKGAGFRRSGLTACDSMLSLSPVSKK